MASLSAKSEAPIPEQQKNMHLTSFTRQDTHRRCPRRYYYRYLAQDDGPAHHLRQNLFGLRELAGLLIHRTMAQMVNELAAGNPVNLSQHIQSCAGSFASVIEDSSSIPPEILRDGLQVAEFFNGVSRAELSDDIDYWRVAIPQMLEHGYRASAALGLGRRSEKTEICTEVREIWKKTRSQTHMVFDVLTSSPFRTVVVDWKTHRIEGIDCRQIRLYLAYLHHVKKVPVSRLYGFGVDLLREEIVPVQFNPYEEVSPQAALRSAARLEIDADQVIQDPGHFYPANADLQLCRACPFATACDAAIL